MSLSKGIYQDKEELAGCENIKTRHQAGFSFQPGCPRHLAILPSSFLSEFFFVTF
jgi:hypothetical protein